MDIESTQPTFSGGELLAGKYQVERVIGQGGMGVVLAAEHLALNQKVAIKLLRKAALEHTDIVGRFMREARAAVRLRSEHVARVLDVGALDDGRPFIVMERLEGQDLGDVIDKGPQLPVPVAVDYVMQACEAITEAHMAGIIHRDLKPKNLFLTHAVHGRPIVKVLDFGISKFDPGNSPQEMQLTRTTEVIGSPSYMSPEQLRSSRNVDVRTDIWSLGVILYELLTGRVPFYAETVTELVLVVVTEKEPPVRTLRPDVPEGLEQLIARCLAKKPEDRFQSVVDLVQALEPFVQMQESSFADRVRAVAGQSSRPRLGQQLPGLANGAAPTAVMMNGAGFHGSAPPPAAASSGSLGSGPQPGVPVPSNSSRVNVHGGTSVAWGETQSQVGPNPFHLEQRSQSSRGGLVAAIVIVGVLLVGSIAGGAVYYTKRSSGQQQPTAVATGDGSSMPLPPGRKDLPPVPPPPTAQSPSGAPSAAPAPTPDPPAASTLPETRKPPATNQPAAKPAPPPPPKPTKPSDPPKGPDDLSNIGRR
jgi:eukaryotic-like serine/threonine-protein kinase